MSALTKTTLLMLLSLMKREDQFARGVAFGDPERRRSQGFDRFGTMTNFKIRWFGG
jgi:hypothetical protein